jgi:hypothetical protein
MTTFLEFKNLIYTNLGGRDSGDVSAALIVPQAINHAIDSAAMLFKPPELYTSTSAVIPSGNDYCTLTSGFIDVIRVYNETGSNELHFVPRENFKILIPTLTTVKFYTLYGQKLTVNKAVAVDTTLEVNYIAYPTALSADADVLSFAHHDPYIIALASALCFAAFEEGDSAEIWARVGESVGVGLAKSAQVKEVVAGKPAYLESTITGPLAGST